MKEIKRAPPFHIKIADIVIRIEPLYDHICQYCDEYLTNESSSFTVKTSIQDIANERSGIKKLDLHFSDSYLETLAVYRQIAERLPSYNTLLIHGSAIAADGIGYLFTAKSGTGKSTHTRLWRECFGNRTLMINDDKPLLKITDEGVLVCGTPWSGKHRLNSNTSVPLKSICVITRDENNRIEKITSDEIYPLLLQQIYRPTNKTSMLQTLNLLDALKNTLSFFKLSCNMKLEAAQISYNGINGGLI